MYTDKTDPLKEEVFKPRMTRIYANERENRSPETQNPGLSLIRAGREIGEPISSRVF
jgi:hypothetical protein